MTRAHGYLQHLYIGQDQCFVIFSITFIYIIVFLLF